MRIAVISLTIAFCFSIGIVGAQNVSDEAMRHFDRGQAAVEMAKTPADYEDAITEFEQAATLAPDWPNVYFNLGLIQEKVGKRVDAIRNLTKYVELSPNASDIREVKKFIAKIEYTMEKAEKKELLKALLSWSARGMGYTRTYKHLGTKKSFKGNLATVNALLAEGAEVNGKTKYGNTPLIWSAMFNRKGQIAIVNGLLAKGAEVNAKNNDGRTALIQAAVTGGGIGTVKALLAKGADVNAKDNNGDTALIKAVTFNVLDFIGPTHDGESIEIVKALLANGADVNAKGRDGRTALIAATIGAKGWYDRTPLTAARKKNVRKIVEALLAKGADPNAKDNKDDTALIYATKMNVRVIVEALLAHGADVNAKGRDGRTALYWAKDEYYTKMIRLLKQAGDRE